MPNGILQLYNKLDNEPLVSLNILSTFNIEDNLNETPSNMKVKVITSNTYREEFQVNTVAYHEDTNSWWVIKSDESSYMTTGEYEHEIQLVEYLEFYAYRHLPNCAFAPTTYTLEQMLLRLFDIAKLSITVVYPDFLDEDKIMPFFSFENFTVANAIKNVARAINAIPKMSVNLTGFVPTLTFINRNGIDEPIKEVLNDWFPIAYEKNINSSDQFLTRSVSNITNAKSGSIVIAPLNGGFKNTTPNSIEYTPNNSKVFLPSKIDKVDFVTIFPEVIIYSEVGATSAVLYRGYYFDEKTIKQIVANRANLTQNFTTDDINELNFTSAKDLQTIYYGDIIDPLSFSNTFFRGLYTLKNKFEFDTSEELADPDYDEAQKVKDKTIHWLPFSNELILAKPFRDGLEQAQTPTQFRPILSFGEKTVGGNTENIFITLFLENSGVFNDKTSTYKTLYQVAYYPIADIKVSIDNDNDAQDEKYFNQSGKVIDAVSVSKLITSHTNDSVEGTKIRNARYDKFPYQLFTGTFSFGGSSPPTGAADGTYWFSSSNVLSQRVSGSFVIVESTFGTTTPVDGNQSSLRFVNTATQQLFISQLSILPLGQLVRDSNQLYVVSQRSIDGMVKNGNEYYNVIYTLSRNRIGRSENIVADSSVISYKTPDDNLVSRSQLYKDYIELSLVNNNQEAPYLNMGKALVLSDTLAGTNFDYTVLAKNSFGTTPTIVRYVKNPTTFDLHKAKLTNVNWQDNNVLGFRFDSTGSSYVQTPIVYTDDVGKATNFELLFLDTTNLNDAVIDYNTPYNALTYNPLVPFTDLTQVPTSFYTDDVLADGRFSIRIQEDTSGGRPYQKDPFEIPVFEYMIQGNDDYSANGNIVIGNDLFSTLEGDIRYRYLINNTTRFTAENADKLYSASIPTNINFNRVIIARDVGTPHIIDLDLFSTLVSPGFRNTSLITNIGIYAFKAGTSDFKFLFAINDYVENATTTPANDKSNIRVFINNWKI